jgi:hypothetical protein
VGTHVGRCTTFLRITALAGDNASRLSDWPAHTTGTKWVFEELHIHWLLNAVIERITDVSNPRLADLKATAVEARDLGDRIDDVHRGPDRYHDRTQVHPFWRLIAHVADLVDEIRNDVVGSRRATSPMSPDVYQTVRRFLRRRHHVAGSGFRPFPAQRVFGELGVLSVATISSGRLNG